MIQSLIPAPASVNARSPGRLGVFSNTTLTARSILLLLAGLLCTIPGFFGLQWLALLLVLFDLSSLPPPHALRITRAFIDSPVLGRETRMELVVEHATHSILQVH